MLKTRPVNPHLVIPLIWRNMEKNPILPPGLNLEFLTKHLRGIRALGFFHGRELVGCAWYKGNKLHLDVVPSWKGRWLSVDIAKRIVNYGLDSSNSLIAMIEHKDRHVSRMAEFFGFKHVGGDSLSQHYELTHEAWAGSPYNVA